MGRVQRLFSAMGVPVLMAHHHRWSGAGARQRARVARIAQVGTRRPWHFCQGCDASIDHAGMCFSCAREAREINAWLDAHTAQLTTGGC